MSNAAVRGVSHRERRRAGGWPRRAILAVAGSAALAFLCLVGATNLALRSDWLSGQINSDPATLFVTYTGARSLVPGRLRFDTLVLRSRDSNIEWEARLEGVSVRVRLFDLLRRRFRAGSVRADALSFRLRERLERPEATPARLARYPRIAGFGEPPLRDPPAPPAPPGNPWSVVVDDLSVGLVREIWIDSWRWTGAARVTGGLFLRSGLEAEVFPSELAVGRGTLHWGEETVSRETAGSVRAALPRFDTQAYPGNEVWKIMSGAASLRGTLDGLAFLAPAGGGPRLAPGGAGTVRARVALRDGRGSARLDAEASAVVMRLGEADAAGRGPRKRLRAPDRFSGRERCVRRHARQAAGRLAGGRRRRAVERRARDTTGPARARGRVSRRASLGAAGRRPAARGPGALRPAEVDRGPSRSPGLRGVGPPARVARAPRALASAGGGRDVLDRRGLARGPRPPLGGASHPQGRPLPRARPRRQRDVAAPRGRRRLVRRGRPARGTPDGSASRFARVRSAQQVGRRERVILRR